MCAFANNAVQIYVLLCHVAEVCCLSEYVILIIIQQNEMNSRNGFHYFFKAMWMVY